jgi:hypothetical protein
VVAAARGQCWADHIVQLDAVRARTGRADITCRLPAG